MPRAMATTAFRLVAASAAGFLLAAAVIVGVLFWQTNEILTEHVVSSLRAEATELAASLADLGALKGKIDGRSLPDGPNLYFLADAKGEKIAGNLNRWPPELDDAPQGGVFSYDRGTGEGRLAVALPIEAAGGARLLIGRDVEEQRAYAGRVKSMFLWGFGLLSLAAILAALGVGRSVLKRIEAINATTRSIMAGDLARRVPLEGSADELDDLAASLNSMLERIEQLMNGLREVSDNIAHDLKTPLNRMRNRAEAALRDTRGPEAYRDGLERTIEEADELIKTFNALLLIARLEAGAIEENAEGFDVGETVRDVAEFYEPVAEEAGLGLDIEVADGVLVHGNRHLVGQAVANLVDNAIKYASGAANKGPITVRLTDGGGTAEIAVADRGPGIAPEDRERALKRFVRLEACRTRPGTGLGLSLVAAVARLHGGSIRLEDNAPGLRAILELPIASHVRAGRPLEHAEALR